MRRKDSLPLLRMRPPSADEHPHRSRVTPVASTAIEIARMSTPTARAFAAATKRADMADIPQFPAVRGTPRDEVGGGRHRTDLDVFERSLMRGTYGAPTTLIERSIRRTSSPRRGIER
jgi:hypothetical protein